MEELGFDSIWDCDDLSWPNKGEGIRFDGFVVVAAMAARTIRVRIGTLLLSLQIRDNPAMLAKEIIALDHLSNGCLRFPEAKDQQLVMEDVANLLPELRG